MLTRKQTMILAGAAVIAAAGVGTGAAVAASGSSAQPAATSAASSGPGYSWYRSMMTAYYGNGNGSGMMGNSSYGSYGWMTSEAGYRWMTGGASSPGWMTGALPSAMMGSGMMGTGTGTDPGKIMGSLWANTPGPRVSAAQATARGAQVPAGAQVSKTANTVTFTASTVRLTILASPAEGPDETFRAVGLVNPRIVVPVGAHVAVDLVNADSDTAHGLVITASTATGSWMPMMTARPAFAGSALWFLGNPTSAGMHEGTLTFAATAPGTYFYLCPVPGHAQEGMSGTFTVQLQTMYSMSPGPMLVREIQQALEPGRAYNTVQTVTEILCRKGWLAREKDGRAYRYRATLSRDDYTGDLMGEALAASSDHAAAFRRFAGRISPAEAEQLRDALEQARRAGDQR